MKFYANNFCSLKEIRGQSHIVWDMTPLPTSSLVHSVQHLLYVTCIHALLSSYQTRVKPQPFTVSLKQQTEQSKRPEDAVISKQTKKKKACVVMTSWSQNTYHSQIPLQTKPMRSPCPGLNVFGYSITLNPSGVQEECTKHEEASNTKERWCPSTFNFTTWGKPIDR